MAGIGYIEGREDHRLKSGVGAETCDRLDRAAWPHQQHRSTYAHIVNLPDVVKARDQWTALGIVMRIDEALGRRENGEQAFTGNEMERLRGMRRVWMRRAAGQDPKFNMEGWRKRGSGKHTEPVVKLMQKIGEEMEKCGSIR